MQFSAALPTPWLMHCSGFLQNRLWCNETNVTSKPTDDILQVTDFPLPLDKVIMPLMEEMITYWYMFDRVLSNKAAEIIQHTQAMNFKMEDGWRETCSFLCSYYHSMSIIHSWCLLISTFRNQTQMYKVSATFCDNSIIIMMTGSCCESHWEPCCNVSHWSVSTRCEDMNNVSVGPLHSRLFWHLTGITQQPRRVALAFISQVSNSRPTNLIWPAESQTDGSHFCWG